jgi:hypothetical protein
VTMLSCLSVSFIKVDWKKMPFREIGIQVGKALRVIHPKGLVMVESLPNIRWVTPTDEYDEIEPYLAPADLTGACNQSTTLMAGIPTKGCSCHVPTCHPAFTMLENRTQVALGVLSKF